MPQAAAALHAASGRRVDTAQPGGDETRCHTTRYHTTRSPTIRFPHHPLPHPNQVEVVHLWAVGSTARLSNHDARGAYSLALGAGTVTVEVTALAIAKMLHGVLMLLGWGVRLPAGELEP